MSIKGDKRPLRKIVRCERYRTKSHPRGTWSVILTLECGHKVRRKGGQYARYRARCWECYLESEAK
jgi:hypothetical protein